MAGGMPPATLTGDVGGGLPAQFRVRPDVVVVVPPGIEHEAGVGQRREQRLVEAFVTQAAVEAFDEAVLHRLARCDVMPVASLASAKPLAFSPDRPDQRGHAPNQRRQREQQGRVEYKHKNSRKG